ncbi:MAG: MBL fold metallo-hydrolase [Muribaculaceae bacterium]|nr:MBL fold metallo-hydrolase [Muribaculaceae bacterium]MBR3101889.1 MBL fold metallo-hydrolase [Muribaculaceae bacterium]
MKVSRFIVNPFGENTYIVYDENSREAFVVDPAMMNDAERNAVIQFIDRHELTLRYVLITHMHIDHVTAARWLADRFGCPVAGSPLDEQLSQMLPLQALRFGLKLDVQPLTLDRELSHNDTLTVGGETIRVIATPGHSLGGLSYYLPQSGVVLSGDTLFEGSVGRVDLPGGDMDTLVDSIKTHLFCLPPETMVAPGHGEVTTISREQRYNPFLQ